MSSIVAINNFIGLLEIEPIWIKILLLTLIINCFYPLRLIAKVETEEQNTKKVHKIFQYK